MLKSVVGYQRDSDGFMRTVCASAMSGFSRNHSRTRNIDRRREIGRREYFDVTIAKETLKKSDFNRKESMVMFGGTSDISVYAVAQAQDEALILSRLENMLAACYYLRTAKEEGDLSDTADGDSEGEDEDEDEDDDDDDESSVDSTSNSTGNGGSDMTLSEESTVKLHARLSKMFQEGTLRLCERIETPFLLMIMAPFLEGILCFQGVSTFSDVVYKMLPWGTYEVADHLVLRRYEETDLMHRIISADQWVYEDFDEQDLARVKASRQAAAAAGATSYASFMHHQQMRPTPWILPEYRGTWLANAYKLPAAAPPSTQQPMGGTAKSEPRWVRVRGHELSEEEYQGQWSWGPVPAAARMVCPRQKHLSLRRYLYYNLNQSIAFMQLPEAERALLSMIKVGARRTFSSVYVDRTTFAAILAQHQQHLQLMARLRQAQSLGTGTSTGTGTGTGGGAISGGTSAPLIAQQKAKKATRSLPKPKGYLAAFNLFCKHERRGVEAEPAIAAAKLSNNELNKIMGQRWRIIDAEKKRHYEALSRQDKVRYLREVEEYNRQADAPLITSRLKEGKLQTIQSTASALDVSPVKGGGGGGGKGGEMECSPSDPDPDPEAQADRAAALTLLNKYRVVSGYGHFLVSERQYLEQSVRLGAMGLVGGGGVSPPPSADQNENETGDGQGQGHGKRQRQGEKEQRVADRAAAFVGTRWTSCAAEEKRLYLHMSMFEQQRFNFKKTLVQRGLDERQRLREQERQRADAAGAADAAGGLGTTGDTTLKMSASSVDMDMDMDMDMDEDERHKGGGIAAAGAGGAAAAAAARTGRKRGREQEEQEQEPQQGGGVLAPLTVDDS